MVAYTTTYNFAKPTVGSDEDAWGGYLNGNFDTLESLLKGTTSLTSISVTGVLAVGNSSPKTWDSNSTGVIQFGGVGALENYNSTDDPVIFSANQYRASDGNFKYIETNQASRMTQYAGEFYFQTAPTGTADTNATFTTRLKINNGGNVGIGTDSPSSTLDVNGTVTADGLSVSGDIDVGAQTGTWVTSDQMSDSIGWNSLHGVYIGSDVSGSNEFIYGDGTIRTGGAYYDLWHAGNDGSGSGLDADTLDGVQGSSFLRSDTSDTTSGDTITFSSTSTSPKLFLSGNGGASSYNYIIKGSNDAGTGAVHFINGSTRTTDGGASTYTIRNDIGPIRLGRTSQSTLIEGSGDLTYNSNEVWHAGNDGSGSGLDADTVDGIHAAEFLRHGPNKFRNNFTRVGYGDSGTGYWHKLFDISLSTTYDDHQVLVHWATRYSYGQLLFHVHTDNDTTLDVLNKWIKNESYEYAYSPNYFKYSTSGSSATVWVYTPGWQGFFYWVEDAATAGTAASITFYDESTTTQQTSDPGGTVFPDHTPFSARNDGSGSGLDADTLDGVQGANYLRSDQADTFNGNLTISSSGTIGGSTLTNGYLQITDGSNRLAFDTNEIVSNSTLYIKPLAGTLELGGSQTTNFGSTVNINGNLNAVDNIYVANAIYHEGDTNTYFQFHAADKARVVCNGGVSMEWGSNYARMFDNDSLYFGSGSDFRFYHNGTNNYIQNRNHAAGNIYIQGEDTSGVNHTMAAFYSANAAPYTGLWYDGTEVFTTVSGGVNVNGNINAVDNIYLASTMYHEGDTNTYMGFATDQINFVTGGATEMQINGDGVFLNGAALHEEYVALSGTTPTCDPNSGGAFSLTLSGNTTFTFGGTTASWSTGFIVELTGNATTAYTVTWPTSVEWAGGTAPDAPAVGETDIYVFWTRDGGTTWYGVQSIDAAA